MLLKVRSAAPMDWNATTISKIKLSVRLIAVPTCGSVPKTRTERSMIKSRNEKKRPTVKGSPVLAEFAAESVTK